jgi:hypothetical protein
MKKYFFLLEQVTKSEQNFAELYKMVKETHECVVKARLFQCTSTSSTMAGLMPEEAATSSTMAGLMPEEAEVMKGRLKLKWQSHSQVDSIFADPTSVALLRIYVQRYIKSGKAIDFHKSFFYDIMDRDLFARSFIEDFG